MNTAILQREESGLRRFLRGAVSLATTAAGVVGAITRSRAVPTVSHLKDHAYSWLAFGFISAAAFYHSVFTGLLVTGIGWLIFEWKVSDEGDSRT